MTKKHTGGCHCGAVKITVELDATSGSRCNCSICTKLGITGAIAKPDVLAVTGDEHCSTYRWGGMTATRYFCKHCGVTCYLRGHLEVLGGDYVSIPLNILDDVDPHEVDVVYWDGRHDNWMAGPSKTPWPIFKDERTRSRPADR
jgi:hypothetical protein